MKKSSRALSAVWQHVLPPVVLVIVLWVTMSLTTNYVLQQIEQGYRRVLEENVLSVQAAQSIEAAIWKLVALGALSETQDQAIQDWYTADRTTISAAIAHLKNCASTLDQQLDVERLDHQLQALDSVLGPMVQNIVATDQPASQLDWVIISASAKPIAHMTTKIVNDNQQVIDSSEASRRVALERVYFYRLTAVLIGPLLGIYFGWVLSRRLQSRVATVAVTLKHSVEGFEVGDLQYDDIADISQVQTLAEVVGTRLRRIDDQLQSARQQVIQSERLAAVGELAAGIAHELRNPLTSVKLLLQRAAKQPDALENTGSRLPLVLREIDRMELIIQGLLDFSRPPTMLKLRYDLRETIRRAVTLLESRAQQHHVKYDYEEPLEPIWIVGDENQLLQVLANLVINAIEAMPAGGQIHLRIQLDAATHEVTVLVQDNGPGIDPSIRGKLFEPFTTTKARGTGLGLAISYQIVARHGGTLSVDDAPTGGTVFTIRLPVADEPTNEKNFLAVTQSEA